MTAMREDIRQHLVLQYTKIIPYLLEYWKNLPISEFWIAGNCMSGEKFNDIDIFKPNNVGFKIPDQEQAKKVSETTSSITYVIEDKRVPPLQTCYFTGSTIEAMIKKFDFSHVQCGVVVEKGILTRVVWTAEFEKYFDTKKTEYLTSNYPMVSISRIRKFYDRGLITPLEFNLSFMKVLLDILADTETGKAYDKDDILRGVSGTSELTEEASEEIESFMKMLNSIGEQYKKKTRK